MRRATVRARTPTTISPAFFVTLVCLLYSFLFTYASHAVIIVTNSQNKLKTILSAPLHYPAHKINHQQSKIDQRRHSHSCHHRHHHPIYFLPPPPFPIPQHHTIHISFSFLLLYDLISYTSRAFATLFHHPSHRLSPPNANLISRYSVVFVCHCVPAHFAIHSLLS